MPAQVRQTPAFSEKQKPAKPGPWLYHKVTWLCSGFPITRDHGDHMRSRRFVDPPQSHRLFNPPYCTVMLMFSVWLGLAGCELPPLAAPLAVTTMLVVPAGVLAGGGGGGGVPPPPQLVRAVTSNRVRKANTL